MAPRKLLSPPSSPSASSQSSASSAAAESPQSESAASSPSQPRAADNELPLPSSSFETPHDLRCAVCLQLLVLPVTTSCGHSLCRSCCAQVVLEMEVNGRLRCPECRSYVHTPSLRRFAVSQAFWTLIRETHPAEAARRLPTVKHAFDVANAQLTGYGPEFGLGGEHGGRHDRGFEVIHDEITFRLKPVLGLVGARNVVRNADDYLMHLALAFCADPDPIPRAVMTLHCTSKWRLKVAMLEMEEDEAADSGFPTALSDELQDTALIMSTFDSTLDVALDGVEVAVADMVNGQALIVLECSQLFQDARTGEHVLKIAARESGAWCSLKFTVYEPNLVPPNASSRVYTKCTRGLEVISSGDEEDFSDDQASDLSGFVVDDDDEPEASSEEEEYQAPPRKMKNRRHVMDSSLSDSSPPPPVPRKVVRRTVASSSESEL